MPWLPSKTNRCRQDCLRIEPRHEAIISNDLNEHAARRGSSETIGHQGSKGLPDILFNGVRSPDHCKEMSRSEETGSVSEYCGDSVLGAEAQHEVGNISRAGHGCVA